MKRRLIAIASMLAMVSMIFAPAAAVAQPDRGGFVRDITDQVDLEEADEPVEQVLLEITEVTRDGDQLLFDGTVTAITEAGTEVEDTFEDAPGGAGGDGNRCDILFLDLTDVELDLLGLNLDLDLVLDLYAEPGPGNLLGNLLCAVAGLLDGPGLIGNIGNTVDRLLGRINNLLG
jgi:hypothetical protein